MTMISDRISKVSIEIGEAVKRMPLDKPMPIRKIFGLDWTEKIHGGSPTEFGKGFRQAVLTGEFSELECLSKKSNNHWLYVKNHN